MFRSVVNLIEHRREDVGIEPGEAPSSGPSPPAAAGGPSFVSTVAPVLASRCVRCHGNRRKSGGLSLATFADMKAGGDSGPLVVPGNPAESPLFYRCAEDDPETRMPKGGQLQDDELAALRAWIQAGAPFDGDGEAVAMARLKPAGSGGKGEAAEVVIPKPTGSETVSFTKDIGPMLDRICLDCHSGANPTGGLSMTTFTGLMRGGESGAVIKPGDAENSRLFRLVGGLELPRMPGNQSRIRRSEYEALKTWFAEGNTFDGPDPDALITSYIMTPERVAAAARSERSADEWHAARKTSTAGLWQKAMRLIDPQFAETADVFAVGNADDLAALATQAQSQLDELTRRFEIDSVRTKGISLLAITTSYGHKEIARSLADRTPGRGDVFHGAAALGGETLYAALDTSRPSADTLLIEDRVKGAVTAAFVASLGDDVPAWLSEGIARVSVRPSENNAPAGSWLRDGRRAVARANAGDVLKDSAYSDEDLGDVGYVLVRALLKAGGEPKLKSLLEAIDGGAASEAAIEQTYGGTLADLGTAIKRGS